MSVRSEPLPNTSSPGTPEAPAPGADPPRGRWCWARLTNRHQAVERLLGTEEEGAADGGLTGPVGIGEVQQAIASFDLRQHAPLGVGGQRLTAGEDHAQLGGEHLIAQALGKSIEHAGDEVDHRNAMTLDERPQVQGIALGTGRHRHQRGAAHQRPPEFPGKHVEAEGRLERNPILRAQGVVLLQPMGVVDHAAMDVHRGLGLPVEPEV